MRGDGSRGWLIITLAYSGSGAIMRRNAVAGVYNTPFVGGGFGFVEVAAAAAHIEFLSSNAREHAQQTCQYAPSGNPSMASSFANTSTP